MSSVSDATSRKQDAYEMERKKSNEAHEREMQDEKENYEKQLRSRNEEYNQRLLEIRKEAQGDVQKLKENLYDRYGKIRNNEALALKAEKDQLETYREELDRSTERKINRIEKMAGDRVERVENTRNDGIEAALTAQRKSHMQEVAALQNELAQYRNSDKDVERDRAAAIKQTVEEYEGKNIDERERIVNSYERQIDRLHQKQEELGDHYSRQLNDMTFAANESARRQVRAQKEEFSKMDHERQVQLKRVEEHFDQAVKDERRRNDRVTNTLIVQNSDEKEKAIQQKDVTYQQFIKDNKDKTDQERMALEAEVKTLKTTGDSTKVSPYVVEKIRKNSEERYYTQLKAESDVNKANLLAIRARDAEDRQALQDQYRESLNRHSKEARRSQDVEKRQFLMAYDDLQQLRTDEKQEVEARYSGSMERAQKKRALETTLEQKRHRDAMEEQREALHGEKIRTEDELNLKNKADHREWNARFNDLRRDYERKMADAKDAHDVKVSEMQYEFDKKLRDSDRRGSKALDDRVKMYEHLLKQQEIAYKEKERFLTEHYEEELDRMKRTNARLIQKKS